MVTAENPAYMEALVTGATSQIGYFLLPRLRAAGFATIAWSRNPPSNTNWQQVDLSTQLPEIVSPILFHLAPLSLLPPLLAQLPQNTPLTRVIAFSSTSRFTKWDSPAARERKVARQLATAEQDLQEICKVRHIQWTLFRPTLIYGCGRDRNITSIAKFIRRFGFFPLIGKGNGLRQPVHADDLAAACMQAYWNSASRNQAYFLSGGQTLTYREMVEAIFQHLGKKPRILVISPSVFTLMARATQWLSLSRSLAAIAMRMNQDLCFEHTLAQHDLNYQPRTFVHQDMGFY